LVFVLAKRRAVAAAARRRLASVAVVNFFFFSGVATSPRGADGEVDRHRRHTKGAIAVATAAAAVVTLLLRAAADAVVARSGLSIALLALPPQRRAVGTRLMFILSRSLRSIRDRCLLSLSSSSSYPYGTPFLKGLETSCLPRYRNRNALRARI